MSSIRRRAALVALAVVASAAPGGADATPRSPRPALARDVSGLPGDSVAALRALLSPEHCRVLDAADADAANGVELPYRFCDDGVPPPGGGQRGIPVPAKYHARAGDDWTGLPGPASLAETAAADARDDLRPERGNRITLDVDVTMPVGRPPRGGFPVVAFMHGCCGGNKTAWEATTVDAPGERWHHSNAWFATRGYVVLTYTARGFRNADDEGSTGTTQLASRRYEVNDFQYLAGLLADLEYTERPAGSLPLDVNRVRVAAVGGSYGGGWAWLAATDPAWRSPATGTPVRLAAAVPKYGWTDLVEALVPSGGYFDRDPRTGGTWIAPSRPRRAPSRDPIGVEKQSIVTGLYASGNLATGDHTTFPDYLHAGYSRLQQGEPYDGDPVVERLARAFVRDRSAYYQRSFWRRVRDGLRVPLFVAATWTDPLFPTMESMRFVSKLEAIAPRYPVRTYLGDYQHFAASKAKEWGDLCGDDRHVCTIDDYRDAGGEIHWGRAPARVRTGITTRIDRFLSHYLHGRGRRPRFDVSATTTICAANASARNPVDEPGPEYRARSWRALARRQLWIGWSSGGSTSSLAQDVHAPPSDPVFRQTQADRCYTTTESDPGPGVVQVVSDPLEDPITIMGVPSVRVEIDAPQPQFWLAARLFDRAADGSMTLVTRGVCRAGEGRTCGAFDLFGNAWRVRRGHRLVLELTQADTPFLRRHNVPSALEISSVRLGVPVAPRRLLRGP